MKFKFQRPSFQRPTFNRRLRFQRPTSFPKINFRFNRDNFLSSLKQATAGIKEKVGNLTITQRWIAILVFVAIASFVFGFKSRNFIPVATVNGEPVDRNRYSQRLLKKSGEGVLNEFIAEILVKQEAEKQHITVSDKEIGNKIAEVEEQLKRKGYSEQAKLSQNPKARPELEREIRNQLLIEKLFGRNIKITDKDYDYYFAQTKVTRGTGAIYESQKVAINQLMYQKKLRDQFLAWLDLQKRDARVRVLLKF